MKTQVLLGITLAAAVTFNTTAQTPEADEWQQNGTRLELNADFDELKMVDGTAWLKFGVNAGQSRFDFTTSSNLNAFRFNKGLELSNNIRSYNSALTFYTMSSNVPKLHIATSGNVAIGHNTPNAKLDVKGDILLSGTHKVLKTTDGEMCISAEEGIDIILDNDANSNNGQTTFRVALHDPITGTNLFKVQETGLTTTLDLKIENLADAGVTTDRVLGIDALGNVKLMRTGPSARLGDFDSLKVKNFVKIGTNSMYLGNPVSNATVENQIWTTDTDLKINGNFDLTEGQTQNTIINPVYGQVGIGTPIIADDALFQVGTREPITIGSARIRKNKLFTNSWLEQDLGFIGFNAVLGRDYYNRFKMKTLTNSYGGFNDGFWPFGSDYNYSGTSGAIIKVGKPGLCVQAQAYDTEDDGVVETAEFDFEPQFIFKTDGVFYAKNGFESEGGFKAETIFAKKINAKEIKVYATAWPDYVFANNYKLKPLTEVESFINKNKHLPNLPSAKTVKKEGLNLGDMQVLQMEKIEELTLYLIEQQKTIQQLKQEVELLKTK